VSDSISGRVAAVRPSNSLSPAALLATSMHAQPGVYAVLLGSGVSTGAGIPTGWGIVSALVRQLAAASLSAGDLGEEFDADAWWTAHHDAPLGYSALLEAFPNTPATRQGLVSRFIEPSTADHEQNRRSPSAAHRELAALVRGGYVKVIITTNFDRLMEQALHDVGVQPQVISRPEQCRGMNPLVHERSATLVKLHGDYKDLESLNTSAELGQYPAEWTDLLRRIFDEYGLIVCGWSADWDSALVAELAATPNRRYALYWDSRSSKGTEAQRVLALRGGQILQTSGAAEVFAGLTASVRALEALAEPPLTTAMAVAMLKRALGDPVRRVDLHDLVMRYADAVAAHISDQPVVLASNQDQSAGVRQIVDAASAATDPLLQLVATGVWHDTDGVHDQLWFDILQRLSNVPQTIGGMYNEAIAALQRYPAVLVLFAVGIAAVNRGRDGLLVRILTEGEVRDPYRAREVSPLGQALHVHRVVQSSVASAYSSGHRVVIARANILASELIQQVLRPAFTDLMPNTQDFAAAFHDCEYRIGLVQQSQQDTPGALRAANGEYLLDRFWTGDDPEMPAAEISFRRALARVADAWAPILRNDPDAHLSTHRDILSRYRQFP
jgi:hypothetical protein